MDNYQTIPISPYFTILVDTSSRSFELSDNVQRAIEDIWNRENIIRKGKLFNGKLLSFVALEKERLLGRFVDYKHYVAQLAEPGLKSVLQIEPVSISGVCVAKNKLLVGKRSEMMTQYPGHYELIPSGGIESSSVLEDRVDFIKQFQNELLDEAGFENELLKEVLPFALVHDIQKESYEVCAEIKLSHEALNVTPKETGEYSQLEWMTKQQLKKFINEKNEKFVPFSIYLLNLLEDTLHHEIV